MSSATAGSDAASVPLPPPSARRRLDRAVRHYLGVSPALVLVGAAFLYPIGLLVYLSFTDPALGLGNYTAMAQDDLTVTVILRTLRMAVVVTLVTLLLAYPYAYVMTVVGSRTRAIMLVLVLMPFWTSLMARTFAWVVLLQETGPINDLFSRLGAGPVTLLGSSTGVTIGMTQVMLPFFVLPVYATLRGIDLRLMDAARGLGATPLVAFARVYLPLSLPGTLAGACMVFILSLGFYVTPALLGSPQESMVAQLMASKIDPLLQFGAAGALAVVVLVITLVLLGLAAGVMRARGANTKEGST